MTNLTELIEQWIGEEKDEKYARSTRQDYVLHGIESQNRLIKDLKSKIPDLIEQIEKEYEGRLK